MEFAANTGLARDGDAHAATSVCHGQGRRSSPSCPHRREQRAAGVHSTCPQLCRALKIKEWWRKIDYDEIKRAEFSLSFMDNNTPVFKADLDPAVKELKGYLDERTRDLQTEALRAFASYNNFP